MGGAGSIMTPASRTEALSLLDRLCARRSTSPRRLIEPGPFQDEIRIIVRAASRGPDHQRLKPFRFVSIGPEVRDSLADVYEAVERELDPDIGGEPLCCRNERFGAWRPVP